MVSLVHMNEPNEYSDIARDFDLYAEMCNDLHDLIIKFGKKGISVQATAAAFTEALEAIMMTGIDQEEINSTVKLFLAIEKGLAERENQKIS